MMRRGTYPGAPLTPYTPGFDVVGTVDKLGDGVTSVRLGADVAALTRFGGYAQYVCVPAESLVLVPPRLDPAEVAALVLNYVAAYQMLHRVAQVQAGERILVHGGGGGVGSALLQLGKLAGAEMYATASRGKHPLIERLGATPIDYKSQDFVQRIKELTGNGVDAVFDPIGGNHWRESYRVLRRGGRLVPYGVSIALRDGTDKIASSLALLVWLMLIPNGRKASWIYGVTAPPYSSRAKCREDLSKLLGWLDEGKIRPVIGARLPLTDAQRAHIYLETSAVEGKVVLLGQR
jgi:NADPH:quinone reductase-like Zn-dependent oxidoreductase